MAIGSTGISPSRGSLMTVPIACDGFTVEIPFITLGLWLDGSIVSPNDVLLLLLFQRRSSMAEESYSGVEPQGVFDVVDYAEYPSNIPPKFRASEKNRTFSLALVYQGFSGING